jgi:hypothetical protein
MILEVKEVRGDFGSEFRSGGAIQGKTLRGARHGYGSESTSKSDSPDKPWSIE